MNPDASKPDALNNGGSQAATSGTSGTVNADSAPASKRSRSGRRRRPGPRRRRAAARRAWRKLQVPKLMGADVELGNYLTGTRLNESGPQASRLLLRYVPGISRSKTSHAMDSHRRFFPSNGGSAYIDLHHAEFPLPEVLSARQFVAAWHATLLIARQAMLAANEQLTDGVRLGVLVNNSDGQGNSYGSHCNFLITRRAFDNLFERKLHHLLFLASFQVSSIILTGQGKVGSERAGTPANYQISQRADFFETLQALQTTYDRPIVNCRDEPLCGLRAARPAVPSNLARLHVIFYDATLCHRSTYLRMGMMQLILALLEAEQVDSQLLLDDPLAAVRAWSRDPDLQTAQRLVNGQRVTAVELQFRFLEHAQRFANRGGFDQVVPDAHQILATWRRTLEQLARRDFDALAGALDWVLKRKLLDGLLSRHPQLDWNAPQLKHLDLLYSSLDAESGLYWAMERAGQVERLVTPGEIERLVHEPPDDTRAWTRAMLLRAAGASQVDAVDWDQITFRLPGIYGFHRYPTLSMPNPLELTRAQTAHLFSADLPLAEIVSQLQDIVAGRSTELNSVQNIETAAHSSAGDVPPQP